MIYINDEEFWRIMLLV